MQSNLTREQAMALLKEYNKEPFHIQHALTVEGTLRWYAQDLGYGEDADFWAMWACFTTLILKTGRTSTAKRLPISCALRAWART